MKTQEHQLSQREFLKRTSQATVAVAACGGIASGIAPLFARADEAGRARGSRISYCCYGEIHVNELGRPEGKAVPQAMKIHAELVKLRDEKVTRFIGFSAHGYFDKALGLLSSGGFDQCMLSYGYIPRGYDQIWTARMTTLRDACVAKAHELGMGIVAMKVMGAGMLAAWSGYLVPGFDKQRLK